MSRYCPNCGSEVPEGASFCASCGKPISGEAPRQEEPRHETASQEAASQAGTATAEQPTTAPTAAQQAVFAPPGAPASGGAPPGAPTGGKGRKGLYLGCGVAAVLGTLALLVVGAVLFLFVLGSSSEPEPQPEPVQEPAQEPEPGQEPAQEPEPAPEPEPSPEPASDPQPQPEPDPEPAPSQGSLEDLVQEQVGDYTLVTVEEDPEAASIGATAGLFMLYEASDGVQVVHTLHSYASPEESNAAVQDASEGFAADGFEELQRGPIEVEGEQVGDFVAVQGQLDGQETQIVAWNNGPLFAMAIGPPDYVAPFFNNSVY
jgi:hypothetical protein